MTRGFLNREAGYLSEMWCACDYLEFPVGVKE
jgi:hypothetical protein